MDPDSDKVRTTSRAGDGCGGRDQRAFGYSYSYATEERAISEALSNCSQNADGACQLKQSYRSVHRVGMGKNGQQFGRGSGYRPSGRPCARELFKA